MLQNEDFGIKTWFSILVIFYLIQILLKIDNQMRHFPDICGVIMVLPHGTNRSLYTVYYPCFSVTYYWRGESRECIKIIPHGKNFSQFFELKFVFENLYFEFRCDLKFLKKSVYRKKYFERKFYLFKNAESPFWLYLVCYNKNCVTV